MDIFRIIGVGLATTVTALIVKQVKPEIAIIVGVAGGIIMLLMLVDSVTSILSVFSSLTQKSGLSTGIFAAVLKIIGVGYITEFSANLCVDAGSTSIANKILLAGKILILVSAIPIVTNLIDIISGLLPWQHLINYLK